MESPFQSINLGRAHAQLLSEVETSIEIKTKWQADPNEKWWSKCCRSSRSAKNKCINTKVEAGEQQCYHGAWPVWKSWGSSALCLLGKWLQFEEHRPIMKKKIIKKNINTKAHNIQNQQHTQMSLSRTDQDSFHFSSWHCDNSHALKPMRLDNKTKKNL